MNKIKIYIAFSALLFSHLLYASDLPQPTLDACKQLNAGDACTFTTPNGEENGICTITENQLACLRENSVIIFPDDVGYMLGSSSSILPDTGQLYCYNAQGQAITCPEQGAEFSGQDPQYSSAIPSYIDNGDGTVTDSLTGLMWQQRPDFNGDGIIDSKDKKTFAAAVSYATEFRLAGYDDWRLPTVTELYSLIDFSGTTGSGDTETNTIPVGAIPYLDSSVFAFAYGDSSERFIDAQYCSSTEYSSTITSNKNGIFGVNFADGRIKGYPEKVANQATAFYVRYVRGSTNYDSPDFKDNGDGTITDQRSDLMWLQNDSGFFDTGYRNAYAPTGSLDWGQALAWCENLDYAGYEDWRLPNAKSLQQLVDYSRSLDATNSAAINPVFKSTFLDNGVNSSGVGNYPYYWTSTTHVENASGDYAVYIAFGEARGYLNGQLLDVHGAGAQRSDPKSGDPSIYVDVGFGPQNDVIGIYNFARCVRNATSDNSIEADWQRVMNRAEQQFSEWLPLPAESLSIETFQIRCYNQQQICLGYNSVDSGLYGYSPDLWGDELALLGKIHELLPNAVASGF